MMDRTIRWMLYNLVGRNLTAEELLENSLVWSDRVKLQHTFLSPQEMIRLADDIDFLEQYWAKR